MVHLKISTTKNTAHCSRIERSLVQSTKASSSANRPFLSRRTCIFGISPSLLLLSLSKSSIASPIITPNLSPDQSLYSASDPQLRKASRLIQEALNATSVEKEEEIWTKIITEFSALDDTVVWKADVVGRATGNRGNARARQGRLNEAVVDYTKAIELCPWSIDPVLNRGVAYEGLGKFDDAISDYRAVLDAAPNDPSGNNNMGNALGGKGDWVGAEKYYGKAAQLSPQFSFAAANRAVALFQIGQDTLAIKEMRSLLRKYPEFDDVRAAIASALWTQGLQDMAENEWNRVDDQRYKDVEWLKKQRRWPPRLIDGLSALIQIRGV